MIELYFFFAVLNFAVTQLFSWFCDDEISTHSIGLGIIFGICSLIGTIGMTLLGLCYVMEQRDKVLIKRKRKDK